MREVVPDSLSKREKKQYKKRNEKIKGEILTTEELDKITKYSFQTTSKFYNKNKPRQKVMETILDKLEQEKTKTTVGCANNFIKKNKRVVADICIKSQYGSKREFYVVNIGAKTLARTAENFF